jgi:hypothetical protein
MGVLEDAIREHLELKRQHGASEEEVVRQETEVLGQARQAAPAEAEQEAPPADEAAAQQEPAAEEAPAVAEEPPPPAEEPPSEGLYVDDEPPGQDTAESQPVDHALDEPSRDDTVMLDDPQLPPEPEPGRDDTVMLEDPLEFDELEPGVAPPMPAQEGAAGAPAEGDPGQEEDVLEETPEFLQETPEHDRLWFEQKPPRDFDFD